MPFNILSALIFIYTVYGMAGLRPGLPHIAQAGVISSLMYLIAVQVGGRRLLNEACQRAGWSGAFEAPPPRGASRASFLNPRKLSAVTQRSGAS